MKLINDILLGFDNNFAAVLLLLDLSAAFDTVNINILLSILQYQIGIRRIAYEWFSSFLYDRTMSVKVNESYSKAGVFNSWYAYHWWYAKAFQEVREIFSKYDKRICFHGILTKTFLLSTEISCMQIG